MNPRSVFLACLLIIIGNQSSTAQSKKEELPYLKYPALPTFHLLSLDSSSEFSTYNIKEGKPTVLFFFSPDCEHCQITTDRIIEKMDSMKGSEFYFFTYMPLTFLRPFAEKHHLNNYKNIKTGKDYSYFFMSYYGATTVPYLAVYDRHKKFVKLYDNGVKISELITLLNSL